MGTYYRWRKSAIAYAEKINVYPDIAFVGSTLGHEGNYQYYKSNKLDIDTSGNISLKQDSSHEMVSIRYNQDGTVPKGTYIYVPNGGSVLNVGDNSRRAYYFKANDNAYYHYSKSSLIESSKWEYSAYIWNVSYISAVEKPGTFIGYVYSTSPSYYPNSPGGGASAGHYYDQRTTVISPTNPTSITFGTPKAGESLTIMAGASTDVVGSGSLTYVFERQIDNGSWTQVAATYNKTITDGVPGSGEYINYRVKARDKNGVESNYYIGTKKPIEYPILITDPGIPQYKYPVSGKEMLVTWDPSAVPEKAPLTYIVEKQIDSEPWSEVARVSENSYTFTVPEVTAEGKRLTIRVKATDNGGNESEYSTGKATEILYHKVRRLIPWNFGTDFRVRQFTKNSRSQYQTMLAGSTAEIIATGNLRLGDMPVGTLVRVSGNTIEDINWKIADQNHPEYPENSTTLITDKITRLMCSDAREPSNSNEDRKNAGNNRYIHSNIHQWLNSDKPEGQWYSAQHTYDAPPTNENVQANKNEYDAWSGFLAMLNPKFVSKILQTTLTVVKATVDGGNSEVFNAKMFLASTTELGLADESGIAEGSRLSLFTDRDSRIAYPSDECVSNSEDQSGGIIEKRALYWSLRTPGVAILTTGYVSAYHRAASVTGDLSGGYSWEGYYGIRPLCNISADTMLDPNPNPDGSYNIVLE